MNNFVWLLIMIAATYIGAIIVAGIVLSHRLRRGPAKCGGWPRFKGWWLARQMNCPVICQKWRGIAPGWEARDHGYSIHLHRIDRKKFVTREETPFFAPDGEPYECLVEEEKFRAAMRGPEHDGKLFRGSAPYPQGVDGWMDPDRGRLSYWGKNNK